jgi:hypothetical protein
MKVSSPVMTAKEPEKKPSPMPPMEEKKAPVVKKVISRRPKIAPSES